MEMKPKLTEYLMAHGVLKNADAEKMAQEIVEMLNVEKLQAQVEGLQADLKDVRQKANHFRNALYMHVESPELAEAWEKAGQLKAEAQTSQRLVAKMGDTITRLSEAIDPDHKFGPDTELVVEHARKIRERNHELEQKELMRSASRPAEAEGMRNVLEESERLKAERDDLKVELFRTEHTNKLVSNENRALTEERDKLTARLDAAEKACAAVRQYSQKVSAVGYKEGVVGSDVQMLLGEHGKGFWSDEQVKPLVEVIVNVLDNFTPDHLNHITCSLLGTRLQQALAHARAVGMEEI